EHSGACSSGGSSSNIGGRCGRARTGAGSRGSCRPTFGGGARGREGGGGPERLLPPDVWVELAATYGGVGAEECWEALFRTAELFRRVATEVGDALGHPYPADVDAGVTAYLE